MLKMALQAPFGTDEQPSVNVKIVGGKALEVKGPNGGHYDNLSKTPYKYSSRPPWFLDDFPGETKKSNKPYLASISSLSSNRSHKKEAGSKTDQIVEEKSVKKRIIQDDPSETEAVDFMLSRLLSQFPASKFKEIYTEMAGFDPRLTSYITEHQVDMTLKRHKVPIPSNLLKQLSDKFAAESNTNMINYENLIKYLFSYSLKGSSLKTVQHNSTLGSDSGAVSPRVNPHVSPHVSPRSVLDSDTTSPRSEQSSYVSPRSLVKKAMDDREEAYLLVQIEQAFKTNGPQILLTLKKLHSDLVQLANGTEYVKADQIERTCSWLHIPLHHSLMGKIINRFNVKKNGKINYLEFTKFLEKGIPLSLQQNSFDDSNKMSATSSLPFWENKAPLASVSPRKHAEKTSEFVEAKEEFRDNDVMKHERKKWEVPVGTLNADVKPSHNSEKSYDMLKVGRGKGSDSAGTVHVMHLNHPDAGEKPDSMDSDKAAETLDEKLERFSHLTASLLRSDIDKDGTLKARDVLRIVNNYNLIYNLHFPEDKVLEIAQSCTIPNTHDVVIDELVKTLWELMKTV
ncbi:uncharacterized protein LOC114527264 [Dendronephthya gigantea]|uniref:uncharacterized protein LOC114527264 n=1 Tax=Dendronephthya gigantea TaxID=151771 RepID=UPI00106BEEFE|nr:uncharacterized protein LOC114527264 [Dendronephthya gigantea]